MQDFLLGLIIVSSIILAVVPFNVQFTNAKNTTKIAIVGLLTFIIIAPTFLREKFEKAEDVNEKLLAKKEQSKRDSLIEAKNEIDKLNIIKAFTDGFARYELKIDKLLPPLNDIKIKSVQDGLIISYQLNKSVEKLEVEIGPNPFDETFDESFGAGVVHLPKRIGKNEYKIEFDKIKLGQKITLLFKAENPYFSLPTIEHYHTANNTTDVIVTSDNTKISADSESRIK